MKPLLLAVLCAGLAGPAVAQTETIPVPDGSKGSTKYDFTIRPKLKPHPVRKARDYSKIMTVEEAKALREDLFAAYANIGDLTRFRFHKRTKDEAPMTAEELGWVENELKDEMALAEKLAPEAEKALKIGIERQKPWKDAKYKNLRFGRMSVKGFSMVHTMKPTFEEYRNFEHDAMGSIMHALWTLVDIAVAPEDEAKDDAKSEVEARQELSEQYASLASARKGMLSTAKEAEIKNKDEISKLDDARLRAVRAAGAGPKGGSTAKGAEAFGVPDGGKRITPEEAAAEANAVEQRAANRKRGRSPAIVPAP